MIQATAAAWRAVNTLLTIPTFLLILLEQKRHKSISSSAASLLLTLTAVQPPQASEPPPLSGPPDDKYPVSCLCGDPSIPEGQKRRKVLPRRTQNLSEPTESGQALYITAMEKTERRKVRKVVLQKLRVKKSRCSWGKEPRRGGPAWTFPREEAQPGPSPGRPA